MASLIEVDPVASQFSVTFDTSHRSRLVTDGIWRQLEAAGCGGSLSSPSCTPFRQHPSIASHCLQSLLLAAGHLLLLPVAYSRSWYHHAFWWPFNIKLILYYVIYDNRFIVVFLIINKNVIDFFSWTHHSFSDWIHFYIKFHCIPLRLIFQQISITHN